MSRLLNIVLAVLVTGLVISYFYRMPKFAKAEIAPNFSAKLIDGADFQLRDLSGAYVLLDFWGSWCAPCRKENPGLVSLYNKHGNSQNNLSKKVAFHIVSVAIETDDRRWKAAIKKDQLTWPHHIVQLDRFKSPIALQYGIREIPTKYLIHPNGTIIMVNPTTQEIDDYLNQL